VLNNSGIFRTSCLHLKHNFTIRNFIGVIKILIKDRIKATIRKKHLIFLKVDGNASDAKIIILKEGANASDARKSNALKIVMVNLCICSSRLRKRVLLRILRI